MRTVNKLVYRKNKNVWKGFCAHKKSDNLLCSTKLWCSPLPFPVSKHVEQRNWLCKCNVLHNITCFLVFIKSTGFSLPVPTSSWLSGYYLWTNLWHVLSVFLPLISHQWGCKTLKTLQSFVSCWVEWRMDTNTLSGTRIRCKLICLLKNNCNPLTSINHKFGCINLEYLRLRHRGH